MRDDGAEPNTIVSALLYEARFLYEGSDEDFARRLAGFAVEAIGGPEVDIADDDRVVLPYLNESASG